MAFVEDLTEFFSTDDFAVTATVGGVPVDCIFDNEYFAVDQFGQVRESSQPSILCSTVDVSAAVHGTVVVVSGTSYEVTELQPDGTGLTRLGLRTA